MPPRLRKSVEPYDAPEPKRRVTRSSTKKDTGSETTANLNPPTTKSKRTATPQKPSATSGNTSKSKIAKSKTVKDAESSTIKSLARAKSPKSNDPDPSASTERKANAPTDLTITHESLKKPIACQTYVGPEEAYSKMIFTHGAGGTLSAPAVVNFCTGYSSKLSIFVFQGGMNLGSRVKGFHACISHLDSEHEVKEKKKRSAMTPYRELILGGRSMGARAAVIAATEDRARRSQTIPTHLVLVSYPLQGPKDVRDQILLDLDPNVNVLFVVGDRDAMCPLDLLNEVRQKMKASKTWLIVVEGVDHGMHGGGAKKEKALGEETGRLAAKWVRWGDRSVIEKRMRWDEEEGVVKVVNIDV